MAAELPRPGVEVIQQFSTPTPTFVRPTLVPCVVGTAFEVIKILNTDGTINSKALYGKYAQLGLGITESAFPNPRNNIDELNILEETVKPYMLAGGLLNNLPMNPGTGFLTTYHGAGKAAMKSASFGGGLLLGGLTFVVAIDQPVRLSTVSDVAVTFTGTTLTAAAAVTQINTALGMTVASVVDTDKVQIASPIYGALSSVTIRAGGSANTLLALGYSGASPAHEERVEGSGWRGQDDNNNNTTTPWIEMFQGSYLLDGVDTPVFPALRMGLYNIETPATFSSAKHPVTALGFGTGASQIPLIAGDFVFADGLRVKNAEVAKVEANRFKLGTINTALSVADANGNYTSKVYDIVEVGTLFDPSPFAPQYTYFKANDIAWKSVAPTAAYDTGSVSASAGVAGAATATGMIAGPFALAGLNLHYISVHAGVSTEGTYTFTGGPFTIGQVKTALQAGIPNVVVTDDGAVPPQLIITTTGSTRLDSITVKKDSTAIGPTLLFPNAVAADVTGIGTDASFVALTGTVLSFAFNQNPHLYQVTFTSNSIDEAVDAINAVVGTTVASKNGAGLKLILTSPLKGMASSVTVQTAPAGAEVVLGLPGAATAGTSRPLPDAYVDDALILNINGELLRDQVTGYPLDQLYTTGSLYIQYKALRKDVTAVAAVAGVLRLSDITTLTSVLDPITEENPLALGLFLAMINAPTFEVKGLGVDEVTAAAPEGTQEGWARAAGLLESEEVYAIAPLTQDEVVIQLWNTHVGVMSQPEQGGERIAFVNRLMPTRANSAIAASGSSANSTATTNQIIIDTDPTGGLVAAGITVPSNILESQEAYLELTVSGQVRRYSVASVAGALVNLRVSFTDPNINLDGFYSTTTLNVSVVNSAYALKVRGPSLTVPGSNPARLDYQLVAENIAAANATFKNRRLYSTFPDTVKTTIQGTEKSLPGYYACAAITGMVASKPPQQGFTNFPMTGLTGVVGTEKFTKRQLNTMAAGGTYILIQDAIGAPVVSRMQVSTDLTSIETRELSITKVVDFVSKFLRVSVRKFIGTNVINKGLLDTLGSTIHAALKFLEEVGVLNGSNINQLVQDTSNPDTVLIDVTLDVPYPCNYIRITLVV